MNTKRETWQAIQQDKFLSDLVTQMAQRGMLGRGAEIEVESDGEVVRWRNVE